MNEPHGLAFYEGKLYVAENDKVRRYDWDEANLRASNPKRLADLPAGGGHSTRTLLFHGGKMYVSAGSSCNVCIEKDSRRAAVMEFNPDGSGQKIFAKGLRNAVGLAVNPKTDTVWATVNGRDLLGDDLPPEVIVDLGKDGGDFGWPYCYGDRVPDPNFTKPGDDRCKNVARPKVQMQAHSAPLGLAFYEGSEFPAAYRNNLFRRVSWIVESQRPDGIQSRARETRRPGATRGRRGRLHNRMARSGRNEERAVDGAPGGNCVRR